MFTGGPGKLDNTCSGWRDAANYTFVEALPAASCAWEFLRRNPAYQEAWRAFVSQRSPFSSDAAVWGLVRFESPERDARLAKVFWLPASLPSVIPLMSLPRDLADANRKGGPVPLGPAVTQQEPAQLVRIRNTEFRLHILDRNGGQMPCAVLPLDQVFGIRAAAAIRLWRCLAGRAAGRDPTELPPARRGRLILALRAVDARLEKASYRTIAEALFGSSQIPDRGWKTHDIRDRTVRLTRLGFALMQGGYRRLLLYPYRRRTDRVQQGWRSPHPVRSPSHRAGHLRHRP